MGVNRVGLPVDAMTDGALLAGFPTGDPDVALAFVRRFQGHVYAVALAVSGDRGTAEDLTQQVFERVWRRARSFDESKGTVRTWLTTITRNLALDSLRRRRSEPVDPGDLIRLLGPSPDQPEDATVREEARETLRAGVRRLPPDQARAVVMAGVYRMTAREVADAESIPLGTAKTRIRTAMIKLREQLDPNEARP